MTKINACMRCSDKCDQVESVCDNQPCSKHTSSVGDSINKSVCQGQMCVEDMCQDIIYNIITNMSEYQEQAKYDTSTNCTVITELKMKTTIRFMRERRRQKWIRDYGWVENDLDRIISSVDALPEDLQDYSLPMVVVGSDVEALYPSLDVDRVCEMIYGAVMNSKIKWNNVDYREAARYIALNWSAEEQPKESLACKEGEDWEQTRGKRGWPNGSSSR